MYRLIVESAFENRHVYESPCIGKFLDFLDSAHFECGSFQGCERSRDFQSKLKG